MSKPKAIKSTVGILTGIERKRSSALGNPRYAITLDSRATYITRINSEVGFRVENFQIGREVKLTFTSVGTVQDMEYTS